MLSKNFRVCDIFARAESYCNEVEKNLVPPEALLAMMKRKSLEVTTFGGGALSPFYTKNEDFNLVPGPAGASDIYICDVSTLNMYRLMSMTVPFEYLGQLPTSEDGNYRDMESREGFQRAWRSSEWQNTRCYYLQLGNDTPELYVRIPSNLTIALDKVTLTYKRLPDMSYTLEDVRDVNTNIYADIPDFFITHWELGLAVDALKQAGMKATDARMGGLIEDQKAVTQALSRELQGDMAALKGQNKDH